MKPEKIIAQGAATIDAIKRVRLEVCHATAILRVYIHDPEAQGILQQLTLAIDDADRLLAKLSTRSKSA